MGGEEECVNVGGSAHGRTLESTIVVRELPSPRRRHGAQEILRGPVEGRPLAGTQTPHPKTPVGKGPQAPGAEPPRSTGTRVGLLLVDRGNEGRGRRCHETQSQARQGSMPRQARRGWATGGH